MSVTIGMHTYENVEPGTDTATWDALERARELKTAGELNICFARVDRNGLVLLEYDSPASRGWHFQTPLCGHDGAGPDASIEILAMFGFGTTETLRRTIRSKNEVALLRTV